MKKDNVVDLYANDNGTYEVAEIKGGKRADLYLAAFALSILAGAILSSLFNLI